ncbi:hypothetical protein GCM10010981_41920 [Dyella nitratireducens]|uniref:SpoVT-AbrB domain-containing protein n=1 Tax=Dyella nitratireducens TaxID=1849580 RepID=A0ABQ1GQS7_9GAMM|nr:hypothetical protein GCM10010981_41920 [Dyella nitratireducens]GLQ42330.1 hypothetical protein GCM10007902_21800 [Dyella nitratireducens]
MTLMRAMQYVRVRERTSIKAGSISVSKAGRQLGGIEQGESVALLAKRGDYALPIKSCFPIFVPASRKMAYAVVQWKNRLGIT